MITERLTSTILKVLNLKTFEFKDDTKAFEVPGWDSLSHMQIIAAVEQEYGIRLRNLEIIKLKSVGDLQILIDSKNR